MERLTKTFKYRDGRRSGVCPYEVCKSRAGKVDCGNCDHFEKILDRLAEYEEIGLTPEQIREMKRELSWVGARDMGC